MRLVCVNPNSTEAMTESIRAVAAEALPGAEVIGLTNYAAPPAIQGPEDGAAAVRGLLAMLPELRTAKPDALILACFDDTGLAELRDALPCPVIGIGQAGFHMALLLAGGFSVVTTLAVSVPVIAENIQAYGFADLCREVRASGIPVLEVEEGSPETLAKLRVEIAQAEADGAKAVVLGCAGMGRWQPDLAQGCDIPVIDGVKAAALMAQAAFAMTKP
ncbi:MAG: aspartate/glutamate racemase family protein [Mangrovicoccus sp.]